MGEQKRCRYHSGGLLGFIALENKEFLNHIKLCELPNVALMRAKPSCRDAIIGEPLKKKKRRNH